LISAALPGSVAWGSAADQTHERNAPRANATVKPS
jgi:hypothetical protein